MMLNVWLFFNHNIVQL